MHPVKRGTTFLHVTIVSAFDTKFELTVTLTAFHTHVPLRRCIAANGNGYHPQ